MIYFIELWNVKPEWKSLSVSERSAYMEQVGSAIQGLLDQGVKVLTWSENDETADKRSGYEYFAIWSFPNQEIADGFQKLVEGAGWYNYFEQVNLMGKEATVSDITNTLIHI